MNTSFSREYQALVARTNTLDRLIGPVSYDCVKLIFVRSGSAVLNGEFGERLIVSGDVVLLNSNTVCGASPQGTITVTTIYLDIDFVLDQLLWQNIDILHNRLDALGFAEMTFTAHGQFFHLDKDQSVLITPWLDELVTLSDSGVYRSRFHRMQALWSAIIDQVSPLIKVSTAFELKSERHQRHSALIRGRRFTSIRPEAQLVREALRNDITRRWTLSELAAFVYLSPSQLGRIFVEGFGKSPIAYLTMLRTERMAQLLRTNNAPVAQIAAQVGWDDPDFAGLQFRRTYGVSPSQYRAMCHLNSRMLDPDELRS